jgi:hypothetical protein
MIDRGIKSPNRGIGILPGFPVKIGTYNAELSELGVKKQRFESAFFIALMTIKWLYRDIKCRYCQKGDQNDKTK